MEKVDIKKLKEMKYNPRKISVFDFQNLKRSIKEFGNIRPIAVNKDYTVIGGHQTLRACKELGHKEVDIIKLDLTKEKAKLLNIALNRIQGEFDYELLDKFIKGMDSLNLSGFSDIEIKSILSGYNYSDLSNDIKKLELDQMKTIEWTAKFKDETEFAEVKNVLTKIKQKNGMGCFKSDYSNGRTLKLLCEECADEEECNAKALQVLGKRYEAKHKK